MDTLDKVIGDIDKKNPVYAVFYDGKIARHLANKDRKVVLQKSGDLELDQNNFKIYNGSVENMFVIFKNIELEKAREILGLLGRKKTTSALGYYSPFSIIGGEIEVDEGFYYLNEKANVKDSSKQLDSMVTPSITKPPQFVVPMFREQITLKSNKHVSSEFSSWCKSIKDTYHRDETENLRQYVQVILDKCFPDSYPKNDKKDLINRLTHIERISRDEKRDAPMLYWSKAFTHETYDLEFNYERLETLGDSIIQQAFIRYVYYTIPSATPQMISDLSTTYLEKSSLSKHSREMKLFKYARFEEIQPSETSISEDLFESFFGALDSVTSIIDSGLSASMAFQFYSFMLKDVNLEEKSAPSSLKTVLNQRLHKFGWMANSISEESKQGGDVGFVSILRIKVDANVNAEEAFPLVYTKMIKMFWKGEDEVLAKAKSKAYTDLEKFLDENNITAEFADTTSMSRKTRFSDQEGIQLAEQAMSKAKSEGFENIDYKEGKSSNNARGATTILIGIRPNGSKEKLSVARFAKPKGAKGAKETDFHKIMLENARKLALQKYLSK